MGLNDPADPGGDSDAGEIGGSLPAARIEMAHSGSAQDEPRAAQEAAGEQEPGTGQGDVTAAAGRPPQAAGGESQDEALVAGEDDEDLPAPGRRRPGGSRRRYRRPGQGLPQADRQGAAAQRRAGGRAGQADRGRAVRRGEARRRQRGAACRPAHRPGAGRRRRQEGQEPPGGGQPAPGGLAGQAVCRPGDAVPGPDPGGEPRPDPWRGEVRLHQGLQVLHLRHLVDPAGAHPGDGRPVPHDPPSGAHGRGPQQRWPGRGGRCCRIWAASPPPGSSRPSWT